MKLSIGWINTLQKVALLGCTCLSTAAFAGEVSLKSADGTVNLVGEFVDYRDDNYVLRTALGELRISAARVRCEGASCPTIETAQADVKIAGSDVVGLGMMPLLMTGFAAALDADAELANSAIAGQTIAKLVGDAGFGEELGSYLVTSTSTEGAFEALLAGDAEIGMASRRIIPAEAKKLKAAGAGNMISPDQERIIAVDSLLVITHPSNPVNEISVEDLRGIYSGQITNWSEIGGPDLAITVMTHEASSSTRGFFEDRIFDNQASVDLPDQILAADEQDMAAKVNEDEGAIGYVGYAFQRGAKSLALINECGIPTRPDSFSAKTEEYLLQRRIYLYSREDSTSEAVQDFLSYAVSSEADGVVEKSGFINLGVERRGQDLNGERAVALVTGDADPFESGVMREMLASMLDNDRLSTTFRFRTGSSRMDEKARIDMARLIDFLEGAPEGATVTLVGFTDDVGAFEANRRLSQGRASQVGEEIRLAANGRLDHLQINAEGYGEIAPSACNASDRGRAINRRVEVWLSEETAG